jgi:hypothetical protein
MVLYPAAKKTFKDKARHIAANASRGRLLCPATQSL